MPLVVDEYTLLGPWLASTALFTNGVGVVGEPPLPPISFNLPARALEVTLAGLELHHAVILLDTRSDALTATTNSVPLRLLP